MPDCPPILSVHDLAIGYGRKAILENISFQIQTGEFVGLLGNNGSGKTTLIRTLIGVLKTLSGNITFNNGAPLIKAYVPQRESLDDAFLFSAREVVEMGCFVRRGPGRPLTKDDKQEIQLAMDRTGCASYASTAYCELSGGQKQRVLLARALVAQPQLLILDEPTSGVDASAATAIGDLLTSLNKEGVTILMVNHELDRVRQLTNRILWIEHGKLLDGTPSELLSRERLEAMLDLKFGEETGA